MNSSKNSFTIRACLMLRCYASVALTPILLHIPTCALIVTAPIQLQSWFYHSEKIKCLPLKNYSKQKCSQLKGHGILFWSSWLGCSIGQYLQRVYQVRLVILIATVTKYLYNNCGALFTSLYTAWLSVFPCLLNLLKQPEAVNNNNLFLDFVWNCTQVLEL